MGTFQFGIVTNYDSRRGCIQICTLAGDERKGATELKPENFRPVHIALRGEIAFKFNCGKQTPTRVPQEDTQVVFAVVGDTPYWALAEEYNDLAKEPLYQIIKKGKILWQGRDLNAIEIAEVYNPRACQKKGISAIWRVSTDNGKTFRNCTCPREYEQQFDRKGNRTIPSKQKKAA